MSSDDPVLDDAHDSPPREEGWTRHQEKYREATFYGADGVVDLGECSS
jgi:hypothetical protein